MTKLPTAEQLRQVLRYDPDTGVIAWVRTGKPAGTLNGKHLRVQVGPKLYYAHRLIFTMMTGEWPEGEVDHIDGDATNNRWANLRDVSHQVNAQNARRAHKDSLTGVLGVTYSKRDKKFFAQIRVDGRNRLVARTDSIQEAQAAYVNAKRQLHEGNTL